MNDRHTSAGDLALRDLRRFKPTCREPHDFDAFWSKQLEGARASANTPTTVTEASTPLRTIRSWSVSFPGWGGQPIAAWLHAPTGSDGPLPCVVEYSGYGQGRGLVHERTLYAQAGYAHLVIDARGQNGATERCDTPDLGPGAVDTASVMTRGLARPEEMYLTRLIVDAARAVDAARTLEMVDPRRVASPWQGSHRAEGWQSSPQASWPTSPPFAPTSRFCVTSGAASRSAPQGYTPRSAPTLRCDPS